MVKQTTKQMSPEERQEAKKEISYQTKIAIAATFFLLLSATVSLSVVYVIVHFIKKFW